MGKKNIILSMSKSERAITGRHEQSVATPSHETIGKVIFPVVLGLAAYGASTEQDPVTRAFPPRHDNDPQEVSLIQHAISLGINAFDTAQAYGDSELILRQAIKGYPRDKLFITTKVGIVPDTNIRGSIEQRVERLGSVPDLLMIHNRWEGSMGEGSEMDSALLALASAQDQGLTRTIGICNFQPPELEHALEVLDGHKVDYYQAKINLVNPRKDAPELLRICGENGIVFMASAALDRGNVAGENINPAVLEIAKKYGMTPAQVGIFAASVLGTLPLVQTHNKEHMRENKEALTFRMYPEDLDTLMAILLRKN